MEKQKHNQLQKECDFHFFQEERACPLKLFIFPMLQHFQLFQIHKSEKNVAAAHRGEPVVSANTGTPSAGGVSFPSETWKLQNLYQIVIATSFLHLIGMSASTIIIPIRTVDNCGSSKQ